MLFNVVFVPPAVFDVGACFQFELAPLLLVSSCNRIDPLAGGLVVGLCDDNDRLRGESVCERSGLVVVGSTVENLVALEAGCLEGTCVEGG